APMDRFLNSNPGLRSRFSREIVFPDYTTAELLAITSEFATRNQYTLTPEALTLLTHVFDQVERSEGFGNARFARTLFEQALNAQALRLAGTAGEMMARLDPSDLVTLTSADLAHGARVLGEEPVRVATDRWWRRSRAAT